MSIHLKGISITSKPPVIILRDNKNRLHNDKGPSIVFNDGYKQYYVHGVSFSKKSYNKFFIDKDFKPEEILQLRNAEQRSAIIQVHGIDVILDSLNRKVIDTWSTKSKITGKHSNCELFEIKLDNQTLRYVKVECHTEHKFTTLGVPITKQTETCKGAIAWTFGVDEQDYDCLIES